MAVDPSDDMGASRRRSPLVPERRFHPVRRLTRAEANALELQGPLVLTRVPHRFLPIRWIPSKWYAVVDSDRRPLMVATKKELARFGLFD